jgi:Hpt domain-containing protein
MASGTQERSPAKAWEGGSQAILGHLPECLAQMSACANDRNWQSLSRLAHQLKEAGVEKGRSDLAPFAARLERAARDRCPELHIRLALDDLIVACSKGQPEVAG